MPTLEACRKVLHKQDVFNRMAEDDEVREDHVREVISPRPDARIIVVLHKNPRTSVCPVSELGSFDHGESMQTRTTTLNFEDGAMDYVQEDVRVAPLMQWSRKKKWTGQTVITFEKAPDVVGTPEPSGSFTAAEPQGPSTIEGVEELQEEAILAREEEEE